MHSERRRGARRENRPPGPPVPPECPVCGECPPPTETHATRRDPCGWVEGDIKCAECGHTLKRNVLLRDPDRV
jgi:hypothetical protein